MRKRPDTVVLYGKAGTVNQFWDGATDKNFSQTTTLGSAGLAIQNNTNDTPTVFVHYTAVAEL
jgi:hypothetical protein